MLNLKENQSIEVRKKYFVSGGCSFVDFYFQLLFGNTSRLKKEYFTIKDMAEMDLNNNHRLFCYPCDLFYRANKEEE